MVVGSYERCRLALLSPREEKWGCDYCLRAMQTCSSTRSYIYFRFHTLTCLYHDNVANNTFPLNDWLMWLVILIAYDPDQFHLSLRELRRLILLYSSAMAAISRTPPTFPRVNSRLTCMESALIISPWSRFPISIASLDLPVPVAPKITTNEGTMALRKTHFTLPADAAMIVPSWRPSACAINLDDDRLAVLLSDRQSLLWKPDGGQCERFLVGLQ